MLSWKDPADRCCLLQMANTSGQTGAAVNMTGLSMTQLTDALRNGSVFVSAQVSPRAHLNVVFNLPLLEHHPCLLHVSAAAVDAQLHQDADSQCLQTCPSVWAPQNHLSPLQHFQQTCLHAMMLPWPQKAGLTALLVVIIGHVCCMSLAKAALSCMLLPVMTCARGGLVC